jgi:general stress protein 26
LIIAVHDTDAEILRTLLRCFDRAMLVTRSGAAMRARPMTLVQTRESKRLWLLCAIAGERFPELRDDPTVSVVMHDGLRFCSVSGAARVARAARAPSDTADRRMPRTGARSGGSARLALIEVTPQFAEYWDKSSSQGVRLEMAEPAVANAAASLAQRPRTTRSLDESGGPTVAAEESADTVAPLDNVIPFVRSERRWRK